MGTIPGRKD